MTDLETHRLVPDAARPSHRLQVLSRIAQVLDRPISDFFRDATPDGSAAAPSADECEQVLAAFLRVKDPEIRAKILDMLRIYSGN